MDNGSIDLGFIGSGRWKAPAIVVLTVALALSAAAQVGAHYDYTMRHGVGVTGSVQFLTKPTGRGAGWGDYKALVVYQRAPNDAPAVFLPVSAAFYQRYKDRRDMPLAVHFLPGSWLRPVVDEDPPGWPWLWPIGVMTMGLFFAGLVQLTIRE